MNISRYIAFSKIILDFSFTFFWFFQLQKTSPPGQGEVRQGSRTSASGVKEKWAGGQGKVRQGLRRSALAEYHIFNWITSPWPLTHFSLTPNAIILEPWRTFPWPLTHFSFTWRAFFSELKKAKKKWKLKIHFFKNAILKIFMRFSG